MHIIILPACKTLTIYADLDLISIRESKEMLLWKLSHYSRKNRLYQAFREIGRVVRTVFLLQYLSDLDLRAQSASLI
jgi:TnpA family transposase